MGRRAKLDILENPTEFDFELRPRHILSEGFEAEVFQKIDEVLQLFQITNPILNFIFQNEEHAYFRFEAEYMVSPAELDIIGRVKQEAVWRRLRIQVACVPLKEIFNTAELYVQPTPDRKEFNSWEEVEVEYKDTSDPRLKRLLKYP